MVLNIGGGLQNVLLCGFLLFESESVGKSHWHPVDFHFEICFRFFLVPPPRFFLLILFCVRAAVFGVRTVMLRHFDNSLSCQIIKQGEEERDLFFCKSWTMYMLQMSLAKWMF